MQVFGGLCRRSGLAAASRTTIAGTALSAVLLAFSQSTFAVSIGDAAATAIKTHPRVGAAQAQRSAANHALRQARGGYYPSVDVDASIGREESNIKSLRATGLDNRHLTRREFSLKLKQLVFDGFETRSNVERFDALSNAAENELGDTREEIAFQAVEAYVEVLRMRGLTELAQANVKDHEEALSRVREKVSLTGKADLHQAEARLSLARSVLASREGRLREAASRYQRVVGELPGDLVMPDREGSEAVVDGRIDRKMLATMIELTTAQAMENHPALGVAQANVEAVSASARGAKSAFYPQVDLEVALNRNADLSGVEGTRNTNAIMLVGSWNLFRGGSDRARERALADQREATKQSLADIRRDIEEQVAIAVQAKATTSARLVPLRAHVAAAEKTLEAYQGQFRLGRRSLLDTLNAANELFTARSNLASGLHDDMLNGYFVESSKGQLLTHLGVAGE